MNQSLTTNSLLESLQKLYALSKLIGLDDEHDLPAEIRPTIGDQLYSIYCDLSLFEEESSDLPQPSPN